MTSMHQNDGSERQMFQGNWKCSGCGGEITQLPFQPDPAREGGLLCQDCHREKREQTKKDRPMFQGNWTCSKCGGTITQLPFEPDPNRTNTLVCIDCFRNK
ncbi:MAG: hypothetical protein KAS07_04645 [Candidatus Pacebacteria bacterium]|nr:hypothetical protein [Candidatus Paceibacterota bacterium]